MRKVFNAIMLAMLVLAMTGSTALAGRGACNGQRDRDRNRDPATCPNYVDANGDGVCDKCPNPNARDDDGDGIPNGQDPDYQPPRDGSGRRGK